MLRSGGLLDGAMVNGDARHGSCANRHVVRHWLVEGGGRGKKGARKGRTEVKEEGEGGERNTVITTIRAISKISRCIAVLQCDLRQAITMEAGTPSTNQNSSEVIKQVLSIRPAPKLLFN